MSSISPTRTLSINACVPPSTRPTAKTSRQSPQATISPTSTTDPSPEPSPPESPLARPSFSAFDEIHLETPRELKPLGLGLTRTATSETFRDNFNRYNNIPPGGGLGNLGNMSRSNSSSSNSSRTSTRSAASSVSTADYPEKPPVYTPPKVEEKAVEEKKGGPWSPLMWLKWLFILGFPTFTLTWIVSLIYFTLLPRLFDSRGKSLDAWIFQSMLHDNPTARQEGIAGEGYREARSKMRKWEVATAGVTGLVWTTLCVVFGVLAVDASLRGRQYMKRDSLGWI